MKKIYRDEKGRFCKYWQTPEAKAQTKARQQTPEYKANQKAHRQKPEVKARIKAREKVKRETPEGKAKAKAKQQKWQRTPEGRASRRASRALRRARKIQREVLLDEAGKKVITEVHANCPEGWHVDHIIPFQGKTISGLHVPKNLQYLPKWVNSMKGNRWEESWIEHTIDTPLEEKIKAYQLNYEGEKWHE